MLMFLVFILEIKTEISTNFPELFPNMKKHQWIFDLSYTSALLTEQNKYPSDFEQISFKGFVAHQKIISINKAYLWLVPIGIQYHPPV